MCINRKTGASYPILALLIFFVSYSFQAHADVMHFHGHGISFDYPDKYQISDDKTKDGWKIELSNGPNSVVLHVYSNPLFEGFSEVVIDGITEGFTKQNRPVTDARTEEIELPIKLKNRADPIDIQTVQHNHVVNVKEGKLKLSIKQKLFFFSHGEQGYFINFTHVNAPERDFATLLSSLTIDE